MQVSPFLFWDSKYNWIAQNDIAAALNLSPKQITTQLQAGESQTQIAAAQGVSASELQTIEHKACIHLFDVAVKSGDISQGDADQWLQQFQHNPQILEKVTIWLFLADTQPPALPTPQPKQ